MQRALSRAEMEHSEGTMKKQSIFVLFLALGAGSLTTGAVAQERMQINDRDNARVSFATFDPSQSAGLLKQADWDDRHRCDRDHDRDDRNCYYRDRDDAYRGNGYYGRAPYYERQNGWYDRKGNFYPAGGNGFYDKHGNWHYFHGHERREWDR
jgi:hypothetical protein